MEHTTDTLRELDVRHNDGIEVRLLWDPATDRVVLSVQDRRDGEAFELTLGPGDSPVEAFRHPYAYAARHGVQPRRLAAAGAR
jgi:hypothetical protein